jgi:hypothetical protein
MTQLCAFEFFVVNYNDGAGRFSVEFTTRNTRSTKVIDCMHSALCVRFKRDHERLRDRRPFSRRPAPKRLSSKHPELLTVGRHDILGCRSPRSRSLQLLDIAGSVTAYSEEADRLLTQASGKRTTAIRQYATRMLLRRRRLALRVRLRPPSRARFHSRLCLSDCRSETERFFARR